MKPLYIFKFSAAVIFLLNTILGCSISDSFQPLPSMFQNWSKHDAAEDDVKRALLLCGYDNPYTGFDFRKEVTINDRARNSRCMRQKGFRYLIGDGEILCDQIQWKNLPACQ